MPIFDFKCIKCSNAFDLIIPMKAVLDADGKLVVHCPVCGSRRVRRLYSRFNVVLVGDGFYKNDSKNTP
jgi:putative FmdB family regulatory protein